MIDRPAMDPTGAAATCRCALCRSAAADAAADRCRYLYRSVLLPVFRRAYPSAGFPASLTVTQEQGAANGGAAPGYVEISGTAAALPDSLRLFVIAHEMAHIATVPCASSLGLRGPVPPGKRFNAFQKAELLADLIALHQIREHLPATYSRVLAHSGDATPLFGSGDTMHPSAQVRLGVLRRYVDAVAAGNAPHDVFRSLLAAIWAEGLGESLTRHPSLAPRLADEPRNTPPRRTLLPVTCGSGH